MRNECRPRAQLEVLHLQVGVSYRHSRRPNGSSVLSLFVVDLEQRLELSIWLVRRSFDLLIPFGRFVVDNHIAVLLKYRQGHSVEVL